MRKDHLAPNEWSRPGKQLGSVRAIVLHWVANPGTSAQANRDFFELRKDGKNGYGSAHFIVDDHEIIEAIPTTEMAYHVGALSYSQFATLWISSYPNNATLGIEMCHPDWSGKPTEEVWQRTVRLCAALCRQYNLQPHQITTHNAITGKECPRWFVHHPSELERFRWDVALHIDGEKAAKTATEINRRRNDVV